MKMVKYEYLRYFDIDDLIILASLLKLKPLVHIARKLRLTPPALSHRIKKYKTHIPNFDVTVKSKIRTLSPETERFCIRAKAALNVLGLNEEKAA